MEYIVPKQGATVTIFAPYDCKNNCPFCVNKKDYKNNPSFDLDKVVKDMIALHNITPACDFVITGGEPFADLDKLALILNTMKKLNHHSIYTHKVFINTTLPTQIGLVSFLQKYRDTITCLNVSRHTQPFTKNDMEIFEAGVLDSILPVRVNTVLTSEADVIEYKAAVYDKLKHYKCIKGFQIREDYTKVNCSNLFSISPLMRSFANKYNIDVNMIEDYIYNEYLTKDSFRWNYQITDRLSWHKTLPYSKFIDNGRSFCRIGDVIITPQGTIMDDWNGYGEELDLGMYRKSLLMKSSTGEKKVDV